MLIIIADMYFDFSGKIKNKIALLTIILLTVVFCGSIDLSCDSFSSVGSIKGSSGISVAHSLISFPAAAVSGNNNGDTGNTQNLEKSGVAADIFCRIARKLFAILGSGCPQISLTLLKHFYISICIAGCTCLVLLTHVRFIHLKDGSK